MIHIMLFILKIIGILLASILGILLFLILVVLIVPIRYQMFAEKDDKIIADAKVSWLLRLLYLRITYFENHFVMKFKIFGKLFYDSDKPKREVKRDIKRVTKKVKNNVEEQVKDQVEEQAEDKLGKPIIENVDKKVDEQVKDNKDNKENPGNEHSEKTQNEQIEKVTNSMMEKKATDKTVIEKSENTTIENADKVTNTIIKKTVIEQAGKVTEVKTEKYYGKKSKLQILQKVKRLFRKIIQLGNTIKKLVQTIKANLMNGKNKFLGIQDLYYKVKEFLHDEINKAGLWRVFNSLKKILRHIRPNKFRVNLEYGTGDPCSTGQALGALAVLYGYYGENVRIIPNFETEIIEGTLFLQGRIRLFTLLIICIKLVLDRNFRLLIKNFREFKEEL